MNSLENKTHLVVGLGQVGQAIHDVLKKRYEVHGIDKEKVSLDKKFDVLHICFPYIEGFIELVSSYKNEYATSDALVIIHSTIPSGISRKCGAVHSPVRGLHPNLVSGVKTFVKYFGGERAKEASEYFSALNIPVSVTSKSENIEVMKLWDTTIYAWNIVLEKEIYRYCQKHDLDFNLVYRDSNKSYNEGYEKLGHPEFKKYILKHVDGKIGGHCLIPNAELLGGAIAKFILEINKEL